MGVWGATNLQSHQNFQKCNVCLWVIRFDLSRGNSQSLTDENHTCHFLIVVG